MGFSDDVAPRPRDFGAAGVGDDAIGAELVAAFLHREERAGVGASALREGVELADRRHVGVDRPGAAGRFGDHFGQAVIGLRADDDVDHRRASPGLGALGLGDAAGKRDQRLRPVLAAQPADVGIGLFGGFLADMAGVEDDEVGVLAIGRRAHALGGQQLGHPVAVVDVHLATEAFDFEGLGSHAPWPIGEWAGEVKPSVWAIASRASCVSCLRSSEASSGARTLTVTRKMPRRPRILLTLSAPASSNHPTSARALP